MFETSYGILTYKEAEKSNYYAKKAQTGKERLSMQAAGTI